MWKRYSSNITESIVNRVRVEYSHLSLKHFLVFHLFSSSVENLLIELLCIGSYSTDMVTSFNIIVRQHDLNIFKCYLGVVHILRNQPRGGGGGGGFQMLTVDYGGGGGVLVVDYVIKLLIFYQFS